MNRLQNLFAPLFLFCVSLSLETNAIAIELVDKQIASHPRQTGVYVLETGAEALRSRAWLADHAQHSIEVQYFIWSSDNIGILAAETLMRAAKRGVKVRVIVDDLLVDADDKTLLALAKHPNVDIRIYNPKTTVGVTMQARVLNAATDFRGLNQRMHNKTFIVDGKVGITGGRNMASEYYDYNSTYNFRDRDVLLLGEAVAAMQASFEEFWRSELAVPVAQCFDELGLWKKRVKIGDAEVVELQKQLHAYAAAPSNFAPAVRDAIDAVGETAAALTSQIAWGKVEFISDKPGKNDRVIALDGGGASTAALQKMVEGAKDSIVIQSPYLVVSDEALKLLRGAVKRGVKIRINTNSLAATDNLPAFSGYRNQRAKLLKAGFQIYEYKPNAFTQRQEMNRVLAGTSSNAVPPITALHAKTMVVDSKTTFIGTFNFDPRSENLNTEAGVIIHNEELSAAVRAAIENDMRPENSWNAATDAPDSHVSLDKRAKLRALQTLPIKPLL